MLYMHCSSKHVYKHKNRIYNFYYQSTATKFMWGEDFCDYIFVKLLVCPCYQHAARVIRRLPCLATGALEEHC